MRIAVVDDDASIRRALARLLAALDFEAATFATGAEFLDSLSDRVPDCLMLDLHMPSMTGLEVQEALTEAGIELPIIIITGHDEPKAIRQSLEAGAAVCLSKPLDDELLLETINTAVYSTPRSSK
ncbi:response regulator [Mesorhizobium sp. WSM2239]|uniref:Response regulator n=1 Tax=Mesorhizobium sp. WSM2239 TaxID=3228852 RepID=A0AAU8D7X6_9HYPH